MTRNRHSAAVRKAAARYLKIVEWSDEDGCFVGRAPGLFFGGCHGAEERRVYAELCDLVEEHVSELLSRHEALPAATAGKTYSGKFIVRIGPELHRKAAMRALSRGTSLNQVVATALAGDVPFAAEYPEAGDGRLRIAEEAYAAATVAPAKRAAGGRRKSSASST